MRTELLLESAYTFQSTIYRFTTLIKIFLFIGTQIISVMALFYTGKINCGKWNPIEEKYANDTMQKFVKGQCTDCPKGLTLEMYLAYQLNCPISRISNKFIGKSILKAKYLEEELDDFVDQDFAKPLPCSEELTKEFVLLIEEEQSRLIEYLAAPGVKQLFSPMKYLIQRDALFDQKAQKIKIGKDNNSKTCGQVAGKKRSNCTTPIRRSPPNRSPSSSSSLSTSSTSSSYTSVTSSLDQDSLSSMIDAVVEDDNLLTPTGSPMPRSSNWADCSTITVTKCLRDTNL